MSPTRQTSFIVVLAVALANSTVAQPQSAQVLAVTSYGAVANDKKGDTSAFVAALGAAEEGQVKTVYVPVGRYELKGAHNGKTGWFILGEKRLGQVIDNNRMQRCGPLLPQGFPKCISVRNNTRNNYASNGRFTVVKKVLKIQNPNFTANSGVRLAPVSPDAFGRTPVIKSISNGQMEIEPGNAAQGAIFAYEIWSDHAL